MGFQSSFNQALGILASASLGARHIKGQKESLKEQKMQGKFNVERELNREQEQQEVGSVNNKIEELEQIGAENDRKLDEMANEMAINDLMASRAGQALANETISKGNTSKAVRLPNHKEWLQKYMEFYGVGPKEAMKAYDENAMRITAPTGKTVEKVLSSDSDELLNKEKKYKGGNE